MSKKTLEAEFQKLNRAGMAEDQFKQFIYKWWQTILYAIGGLLLFSILLYQFTRGGEAAVVQEYAKADLVFAEFSNASGDQLEDKLGELKRILAKYPDLKQKYNGKIAQVLLSKNKPALAIPFAQDSMTASKKIENAPFQVYSDTSLLIAQGKLAESLEKAKALQASLPKSDTLYAFNLMRIATLEEELGNAKSAKAAYKELLSLGDANPLFENWLGSYKEGDLTFKQYLSWKLSSSQ